MKLLNSKLVSCESETIEYNSLEEFNEDKFKRRRERWNITKTPDNYGMMKDVIKHSGNKIIIKWVRYGELPIG